ncbi:DNA repair protein RadC [Roseivirga sp. BDSF3-8]|uniref:RadC family protein n=1 Tax=Roseivirga sp. BDSF3-8 TaxID=3241598 RepID=UPI003531E613
MKEEQKGPTGIYTWAEEDRPREKLLLKGKEALSDAELLTILIGSGSAGVSALDLSKNILKGSENSLDKLGKLSVRDLMKFKGIGEAKAISIIAALELGRRRRENSPESKPRIRCSRDAYDIIWPLLADQSQEQFWVIMMNRAGFVVKKSLISQGGVDQTSVDPRVIFKEAISELCSTIILVHNHPSGNVNPSKEDIAITRKLSQAGNLLDIKVADHIIFTNHRYYSFLDEDIMP